MVRVSNDLSLKFLSIIQEPLKFCQTEPLKVNLTLYYNMCILHLVVLLNFWFVVTSF